VFSRFFSRAGQVLRPLLRPDWAREQEQVHDLLTRLRDGLGSASGERRQLERRIADLGTELATIPSRRELNAVTGEVRELRRVTAVHARSTSRALKYAGLLDGHAEWQRRLDRLVARAAARGTVIAGPWTGEVGFELLYWIPLLRHLRTRLPSDTRLISISRGGAAAWYAGISTDSADVFDDVDVETFLEATSGESRKQRRCTLFDRRVLRNACRHFDVLRPAVMHPSLLYDLLYPYLKDQVPARVLLEHLDVARLAPPPLAPIDELPERYVAARFYFSKCFPDSPGNRRVVRQVIEAAARHSPVVLLGSPFKVDDHVDAEPDDLPVIRIENRMRPENNLAVQSAVIARAQGFVGTYGGFAYLAPFYDVPAIGLYSSPTFFPHHLDVARRTYDRLGGKGLSVLRVDELDLASAVLGGWNHA
jgi:hypothetical protein